MFDLNEAVTKWRRQMAQAGASGQDELDEMESHVRDETACLRRTGLTEEEAFLVAARRLGSPAAVGAEFCKINPIGLWRHRLYWMAAGVVAYLCVVHLKTILGVASGVCMGYLGFGPERLYLGMSAGNVLCAATSIGVGVWLARRGMRLPRVPAWTGGRKARLALVGAAIVLLSAFGLASGYALHAFSADVRTGVTPGTTSGTIAVTVFSLTSLVWTMAPLALVAFLVHKRDWGRTPVTPD